MPVRLIYRYDLGIKANFYMNSNDNKLKILLVDDDVDILLMMTILLKEAGYEVEGTLNGHEAVTRTMKFHPDLIIMDVFLSGTNGKDICKTLKNSEATKRLPVILISSEHQPEAVVEYGADEFIDKPFQINLLLDTVRKFLPHSRNAA